MPTLRALALKWDSKGGAPLWPPEAYFLFRVRVRAPLRGGRPGAGVPAASFYLKEHSIHA